MKSCIRGMIWSSASGWWFSLATTFAQRPAEGLRPRKVVQHYCTHQHRTLAFALMWACCLSLSSQYLHLLPVSRLRLDNGSCVVSPSDSVGIRTSRDFEDGNASRQAPACMPSYLLMARPKGKSGVRRRRAQQMRLASLFRMLSLTKRGRTL